MFCDISVRVLFISLDFTLCLCSVTLNSSIYFCCRMSSVDEHQVHDEDEVPTMYVPPPQKSIGELVAADQEDESLRKYKEALLGNAITESIVVGLL